MLVFDEHSRSYTTYPNEKIIEAFSGYGKISIRKPTQEEEFSPGWRSVLHHDARVNIQVPFNLHEKNRFDEIVEIEKTVKMSSDIRSWNALYPLSQTISILNISNVFFQPVGWRIGRTQYFLPIRPVIKSVQFKSHLDDALKLEDWNYLNDDTFLYMGKERGLYADPSDKRQKTSLKIQKGDLIVPVERNFEWTSGASHAEHIDAEKFLMLKDDEYLVSSHFSSGFYTRTPFKTTTSSFSVSFSWKKIQDINDKETLFVNGWLQVLAGGTHGWMKLNQKSIASIERDFIASNTEKFKELLSEFVEKDKK